MKFTSTMPLCSGIFRMERVDAEKLASLLIFEEPSLIQVDPALQPGLRAMAPGIQFTDEPMRLAPFDSFVFMLAGPTNPRVPGHIYIIHYDHVANAIDDPLWAEIDGADEGTPLLLTGGMEVQP